jgi:hypothetical protein
MAAGSTPHRSRAKTGFQTSAGRRAAFITTGLSWPNPLARASAAPAFWALLLDRGKTAPTGHAGRWAGPSDTGGGVGGQWRIVRTSRWNQRRRANLGHTDAAFAPTASRAPERQPMYSGTYRFGAIGSSAQQMSLFRVQERVLFTTVQITEPV